MIFNLIQTIDAVAIAMSFLGTPYVWGGNDITTGLDCSGMVCEVMRSTGKLGNNDLNSQGLYNNFKHLAKSSGIKRNSLLFFGASTDKITHVAIAIDKKFLIEAGGEGRIESDKGYVRIRPISNRSDLVAALVLK
jgi:cell wall-associated NlpC family hydrolase